MEIRKYGLTYNTETGLFTRKCGKARVGTIVRGYLKIRYRGKYISAHAVAWSMVYGEVPAKKEVIPRNRDKMDSRLSNLILLTRAESTQRLNRAKKSNKLGMLGVCYLPRIKRYRAYIVVNRKQKHLGCFLTPEAASAAYISAKRELHPFGTL